MFEWAMVWAFLQVVMIDLVLAGDNAVVVGMADAGLPQDQRRKAILVGIAAATLLRIAFALAVGVVFDAFFVRMTFVPAAMALAGRAAWWLPKWLDRLLPKISVEGHALEPVEVETV